MKWYEDQIFKSNDPNTLEELGGIASPAFRLSAQGSWKSAHPLDHVEAYDRLFQVFRPVLERHAERLTFNEVAGAKPRRRTSITRDDWQPFQHLKSVVPDDDRYWIGFDYQSGKTANLADKGPTGFRFRVARTVQLDATIPVSAFEEVQIDVDAIKDALLGLPVSTAIAGYGMATSIYLDERDWVRALLVPAAKKFPVLDVCPSPLRSWFSEYSDDFNHSWISGINWLTLVSEPFLSSLGGAKALVGGLPIAIEARVSNDAVLFQLGDRPITGQNGQDDDLLPLYRALGDRLTPKGDGCPSERRPREPVFGDEYRNLSLLWERRFYDGHWFEETGK